MSRKLLTQQNKSTDIKSNKIPSPPIVGIGFLLTRRALGLSTAPKTKARRRINGVIAAEIITNKNNSTIILNIFGYFPYLLVLIIQVVSILHK